MPTYDRIEVDYRFSSAAGPTDMAGAADLARRIAFEQTVELPEALITDPYVRDVVVGRVERLSTDSGAHVATVSFTAELASGHLSQLLNLLYGNVSLYPGVRLEALRLPGSVLASFAGPRYGVAGVRDLLGVYDRPLLATALKPRGLAHERLAEIAHQFALGGGDIVKDDQNLVDDLEGFKRRVEVCARAVARANDKSGRQCLYLPHVSASRAQLPRYLDHVYALGLPGILICPMVLGLDAARDLAADYPLLTMAHPALTGGYVTNLDHGISADVLLGTLFRLAGADISIFPSFGGRFSFTRAACLRVAERLDEPLDAIAPAFPCPAGGMQLADVEDLAKAYGRDAVFLVGGALLGHARHIEDGTRAFLDAIQVTHPPRRLGPSKPRSADHLHAPGDGPGGASGKRPADSTVLAFLDGYQWTDRPSSEYKSASQPADGGAFKGVRRVELVGKFDERASSDLRYFEVSPGGFSSHERHVHTHIIIAARGQGTLVYGNRRQVLTVNDVAYVAPLEAHQLRNEGSEPFGFYCIVDHGRDRPLPA